MATPSTNDDQEMSDIVDMILDMEEDVLARITLEGLEEANGDIQATLLHSINEATIAAAAAAATEDPAPAPAASTSTPSQLRSKRNEFPFNTQPCHTPNYGDDVQEIVPIDMEADADAPPPPPLPSVPNCTTSADLQQYGPIMMKSKVLEGQPEPPTPNLAAALIPPPGQYDFQQVFLLALGNRQPIRQLTPEEEKEVGAALISMGPARRDQLVEDFDHYMKTGDNTKFPAHPPALPNRFAQCLWSLFKQHCYLPLRKLGKATPPPPPGESPFDYHSELLEVILRDLCMKVKDAGGGGRAGAGTAGSAGSDGPSS